jgi:hypothetical protein
MVKSTSAVISILSAEVSATLQAVPKDETVWIDVVADCALFDPRPFKKLIASS